MKHTNRPSQIIAPAPRPTRAAALTLACVLSAPVFVILSLVDWLFL